MYLEGQSVVSLKIRQKGFLQTRANVLEGGQVRVNAEAALGRELAGAEIVLRQVDIPTDCAELQTEHLADVLELRLRALGLDLGNTLEVKGYLKC